MEKTTYYNSIYGQTEYHRSVQKCKQNIFDSFLSEYAHNTVMGAAGGLAVAALLTGKGSAGKLIPLYAGIGGGIALNKCASKFNVLEDNEHRVLHDFQRAESGEKMSEKEIDLFN